MTRFFMMRFFAHLCLYLQTIDIPVPPLATQVILEAYLQVLEAAGQRELIAMYAVPLGDNAVERYAMFLTLLELTADVNDRRLALTRAREHGLDVHKEAVVAAKQTIDRAFELLPPVLCYSVAGHSIRYRAPATSFHRVDNVRGWNA
ncbi:hypothetical protein DEU56DRAFT_100676 [Suillus clintonianus]|uniref:uncharacterized protein n=1 Tax=Suillus clintonianus TaxID=1904413 RepID=UPI001B881BD6|nr:uncharacterized protein DEU56DRAFT_100676 [Suillus clintonianus]KAG2121243.1 hypothetical protein DEU56DRAFT_100676 [Suillus clintonianus]